MRRASHDEAMSKLLIWVHIGIRKQTGFLDGRGKKIRGKPLAKRLNHFSFAVGAKLRK